jgi:hypothetical protein
MHKLLLKHPFPKDNEINIKKVLVEGWLHPSNRILLQKYINIIHPKIILELGAWKGMSTIYMLTLFDGNIISIDNWSGGNSILVNEKRKQKHDVDKIYNQYLRNVYEYRERVTPIKIDGRLGIKYIYDLGIKPDLIYLDMDHTYDSVSKDLETIYNYFPNVPLIGDDIEFFDDVRKAVTEYIHKYNYNIDILGNCYYISSIIKKNIIFEVYNKLNYSLIDYEKTIQSKVLILTINNNNFKNITDLYNIDKIKYKVCYINNNYGSLINSIILENNEYNNIILLLNNYIIDINTAHFFMINPFIPIIYDKSDIFLMNNRITMLSICRKDYFDIEGLPNIDDINKIQTILYLRLSTLKNVNITKFNFINSEELHSKKIKIPDESLYIENSFKNGINSICPKYINKKCLSKNIYEYNFDTVFPQHNLKFYQQNIIIKLDKVSSLKIKYKSEIHPFVSIYNMDDWEVKKLIVNNSAFFTKISPFENIILEALNILNITNLKYKDIMVFYHSNKDFIRTYETKYTKSYKNFVKNIINSNINSFSNMNNINDSKEYDFIFINKIGFNKKIELIIKNLKMNGSGIIYYDIYNYKMFEYFIAVMSYMFNNVYLYKPYNIMGHQMFVYILVKEKITNIDFNFDKHDYDININNDTNNTNLINFYKQCNILSKTVINTYNEVCILKNDDKKKYKIFYNNIIKKKNKLMLDKTVSAGMNKLYLNL